MLKFPFDRSINLKFRPKPDFSTYFDSFSDRFLSTCNVLQGLTGLAEGFLEVASGWSAF